MGGIFSGVVSKKPFNEQEAGSELSVCPRVFWKVLGAAAAAGVGPLVPEAQLSHVSQNRKGKGSEHCDRGQPSQPWAFFGMKCPVPTPHTLCSSVGRGKLGFAPVGGRGSRLTAERCCPLYAGPPELGCLWAPWLTALPSHYIAHGGTRRGQAAVTGDADRQQELPGPAQTWSGR